MTKLEFPDLLRWIDERSTAFRAAIAAAPSLDLPVPTCPGWTLADLAQHLGQGRRAWAATIHAGPDATAKSVVTDAPPATQDREELVAWWAESTRELLDALRAAGPERACWTWWAHSQSPQTCAAVARHQLQEIAVHTYDAQIALGAEQPLPVEVALDGVEDFLFTCCATTAAWPHAPVLVDYHATEGRSWRQWLAGNGSGVTRQLRPDTGDADDLDGADASFSGTAGELVLWFYGRIPVDSLKSAGDRGIYDKLVAWEPEV